MELEKKHYIGIFVLVVVIAVLLSQFPLSQSEPSKDMFEDKEDFWLDVPDYEPDPADFTGESFFQEIPEETEVETSGPLGKIVDNVFVPDETTPTLEEVNSDPIVTGGKNSITAEFYGGMHCEASKITHYSFINQDNYLFIVEEETIDDTKFLFGPTDAPPEEKTFCFYYYKTTVTVPDLEPGKYDVIVEKKDSFGILYENIIVK